MLYGRPISGPGGDSPPPPHPATRDPSNRICRRVHQPIAPKPRRLRRRGCQGPLERPASAAHAGRDRFPARLTCKLVVEPGLASSATLYCIETIWNNQHAQGAGEGYFSELFRTASRIRRATENTIHPLQLLYGKSRWLIRLVFPSKLSNPAGTICLA